MPQPKSAKPTTRPPTKKSPPRQPTAPSKAASAAPENAEEAGKEPSGTSRRRSVKRPVGPDTPPSSRIPAAPPASPEAQAARDEALRANLTQLRELLTGGIMLTAQRVQEAMDDAVRRGKMTRRDAEELARGLVEAGRRQSQDIVADIEQLLGRGRSDLGSASDLVREGTDRVLREVERVRRTAGVGPSFPIIGYDELTAAQVTGRLADLDPSQLRRIRDHERRTGNRKSVLTAIDKLLA